MPSLSTLLLASLLAAASAVSALAVPQTDDYNACLDRCNAQYGTCESTASTDVDKTEW